MHGGLESLNLPDVPPVASRKAGEAVNIQHKRIRTLLQVMSPRRAEAYIMAFQLRPEEEAVLIECDVRGLSYIQAGDKLHMSPDVIKRRKQAAYRKIADEIAHKEDWD